MVESVTFGQSENHAGLQIADMVCSAPPAPIRQPCEAPQAGCSTCLGRRFRPSSCHRRR
ncbi:MAG: DUF3800 domain-containing protein [Solirubrobacterales bacterium]